MPTEILLRPSKKKNITFEKTAAFRSISISIFTSVVTLVPTSAAKITTKTMKPVRQKLINKMILLRSTDGRQEVRLAG